MQTHPDMKLLSLAYDLVQGIQQNHFEYIYRGMFTTNITNNILLLTEPNLNRIEDTLKIKKRIYFIMVECLQNITRHQEMPVDSEKPENSGIFILQKRNNSYFITTGNLIHKSSMAILQKQLEKVNSMNKAQLKAHYQEILAGGQISEKGGAGLGFVAMVRKSQAKLRYDFREVDENYSYFYLRAEVPLSTNTDFEPEHLAEFSLEKTKQLHTLLNQENILLNFNGAFTRENLENLLPMIQEQIEFTINVKERVFKIMFEMLQNIVNYGESYDSETDPMEGCPGIFLLSEHHNQFFLTAGNYLASNKVETLKQKLEFVNELTDAELLDFYNKISSYFQQDEIKKPDLSIMQMRSKSTNPLFYEFKEFNQTHTFFTLQTVISNND